MNHIDFKKKSTNSYEQLLMTLSELTLPHEAYVEVLRRMIFNIMGRNCDDHSKNFAFLLKEGSDWQLAPAYDVTFAHNPAGEWTHQHLLSVNGKYKDFNLKDLIAVADRFGVGEVMKIVGEVRAAIKSWPDFAKEARIDKAEIQRIGKLHILL
jgi:serine/threonine-protein kinase HipA